MKLKIYQIDAFASEVFKGNPAAVIPLKEWLEESVMQKIAQENNISETAFFVPSGDTFDIRWFTPSTEVALCGHATLASAFVLYEYLKYKDEKITFMSKSGELTVRKDGEQLIMNFPSKTFKIAKLPDGMLEALGALPVELFQNEDYIMVLDSEKEVRKLSPNFDILKKVKTRGIIVTAKGNNVDFVSRFFAPNVGVDEDPVTGSTHSSLIPYWSKKLGKRHMVAEQVSKRGGIVKCRDLGARVEMSGSAVCYLTGDIHI